MNYKKIKKFFAILLIVALVFYLTGCQAPVTGPESTLPPVSDPLPPAVIEPAPTTSEEASGIDGAVTATGTLDEDLELDELDDIDAELDGITW